MQTPFPDHDDDHDVVLTLLVSAFAALVATASIVAVVLLNPGFPLDDAWIHQVVGRNSAIYGIPSFLAGVPASGSSSVLWPWIIAFGRVVFPNLGIVPYLLIVNVAAYLTILTTLHWAAARDGLPILDRIAITALAALTGNVVWLIASGMEHLPFVAVSFVAALLWISPWPSMPPRRALISGACCALAVMLRPEGALFAPLLAGVGLAVGRSRRDFVLFLLPSVAALVAVVLVDLWTSGAWLPTTIDGRRWLYFRNTQVPSFICSLNFVGQWCSQILRFFVGIDPASGAALPVLSATALVIALGVSRLVRLRARTVLVLLALSVTDFAVYCVMLPTPGHGMRYQAMLLVVVFPLMALGALELVDGLSRRLRGEPNGSSRFARSQLQRLASWRLTRLPIGSGLPMRVSPILGGRI